MGDITHKAAVQKVRANGSVYDLDSEGKVSSAIAVLERPPYKIVEIFLSYVVLYSIWLTMLTVAHLCMYLNNYKVHCNTQF